VRTGAAVTTDEGREVGYLGTVVDPPGSAKALGLAVIKRKYAEPGTLLVVDELPAEVVDLPVA
jgi:glycine cleavage system aminomethyltransferase T